MVGSIHLQKLTSIFGIIAKDGKVVKYKAFIPTKFLKLRHSLLFYLLNHNIVSASSSKNVMLGI